MPTSSASTELTPISSQEQELIDDYRYQKPAEWAKQPVVLVALASIIDDDAWQPRVRGLDTIHLKSLRSSDPDGWEPILVCKADKGRYRLVDGFHRIAIAREKKLKEIRARVIDAGGMLAGAAANLSHGLKLTVQDRKRIAKVLHQERPDLSIRAIARIVGLHPTTVSTYIKPAGLMSRIGNFVSDLGTEAHSEEEAAVTLPRAERPFNPGDTLDRTLQKVEGAADWSDNARASAMMRELARYKEEDRASVAQAYVLWGQALISAGEKYIAAGSAQVSNLDTERG